MSYNNKFNYLQDYAKKLEELEDRMKKLKIRSEINKISLKTLKLFEPLLKKEITGYEKKITKIPSILWYFGNLCYILDIYCYSILEDEKLFRSKGQSVRIPQGDRHRAWNESDQPIVFIEVQTGSYFGEDDIIRIEDDYSRN